MKPYPKTKPSGVQWLGDVPKHWEVKRLRRLLSESLKYGANESAELDDPDLPRYVRITDVHEDGTLRPETFRSLPTDVAAPYLLEEGDLLLARSGATSGKTFLYRESWGKCAYAGYLIRARMNPAEAVPSFIKFFTTSTSYWQWLSSTLVQATIQNVSAEKYADLPISLPPLVEQTAIVSYLDRETGRIDELVGKKRELIERLKEKRTALISRTVTRGLPADLPPATLAKLEQIAGEKLTLNPTLKPSGIEWLGEVPEHWEVKRLKFIFPRLYSGVSVNSDSSPTLDESPGILKTSCVYGNKFSPEENKRVLENELNRLACPVTRDSLIISRMNTPELVGSCGYVDHDYSHLYLPDRLWIARFINHSKAHGKFAWYLVVSHAICALTGSLATGTSDSMKNLTQEAFLSIPVSVPPPAEQSAIAAYLDEETVKLDALVAKVEIAIERLQEYRTALITAAVTGKIDVTERINPQE